MGKISVGLPTTASFDTLHLLITWKSIYDLFRRLSDKDKESFCFENTSKTNHKTDPTTSSPDPQWFFCESLDTSTETTVPKTPYYSSFFVQNDESSLNGMLVSTKWSHEPYVYGSFLVANHRTIVMPRICKADQNIPILYRMVELGLIN